MSEKVKIGQKSKVNIKWNVLPIDYSKDAEETIINKFSKKKSIPKENIRVEPVFIQKNDDGEVIPITNDVTQNIQNKEFQQELFKKYLKEREIEDYDFDEILEIDSRINNNINYELYDNNKRYSIKWIRWSNFMSYGEDNFFDFTTLKGLVLLTSEPANQGGKSTFCLDLIRFLLFGKVTSRESDWVLAKVFNKHLPDATEVLVEGCVVIDGQEYVIKRSVTRPASGKRTDKSKVSQKVNYYRLVNDEMLELVDQDDMEGTTTTETNKSIKEAIGNERDFDLMICVDQDNLKGLISLKDTERGRLISRWIGLLPLEDKEKNAKEIYKEEKSKFKSNLYSSQNLKEEIEALEEETKKYTEEVKKLKKSEKEADKKIENYTKKKEKLLESKTKIDESLTKVDVKTLEAQIDGIVEDGKRKRAEKEENEKKLSQIKCTEFNEAEYKSLEEECLTTNAKIAETRVCCNNLKNEIKTLKTSEYCPTCGAKLKNVDNSEAIKVKEEEFKKLCDDGVELKKKFDELVAKKENLNKLRIEYNEGIKLKLKIETNDAEIDSLGSSYREKRRILKNINDNKVAIENNNKIDNDINVVKANIDEETRQLKQIQTQITDCEAEIKENNKNVKDYKEIIAILEKEAKVRRNWEIYLEMIGKNGISKLVLRNTLPLINGELKRLLNGVCDFYVEVTIDDRNDVSFDLIHDNVRSNLASGSGFEQTVASLALRSVLSKISTFSKPSFVVFDEILGGVADENYDNIKLLYDKIVKDYDFVLQITHLKQIADWHDKTIIVRKENNISTLETA